jgi:flagella basal body P-ring formation protein FlgA
MHDGDPATLVFDNSRLRISLPVICLQSGSRGQTIRVESRDHKRFFKAKIVESGLLKATL